MKRQRLWIGILLLALLGSALGLGGCGRQEAVTLDGDEALSLETPTAATATPLPAAATASDVILMDGELVSAYPSLLLAFPEKRRS